MFCPRFILIVLSLVSLHIVPGGHGWSQEATPEATPEPTPEREPIPSISDYRFQALRALEKGDRITASDTADLMLLNYKDDSRAIRIAGDLYLRSGKIHSSIKQFERYIEKVPGDKPELWQYGIALTLANQYEEGRKLFELHRVANPNDVENAAWHFLCVAKLAGLKEAKKTVLPAPGDTRIPMEQIRRLLIDGVEQPVMDAMTQPLEGTEVRKSAEFYGNLYLGLHADAMGNRTKAIRLVGAAVKLADANYMSDVAKVYLAELEAEK
jgi:lipoprotein NlpI